MTYIRNWKIADADDLVAALNNKIYNALTDA
jgi:hypothetical protein